MTLEELQQPVEAELKHFDAAFKDILTSNVELINEVADYLVLQKGKRLRSILVFLSSRLCGDLNENSVKAAITVEMLHNATLIHDDVIDNSDMRRGSTSVNSVWENKVSVLMGDYLLANSLLTAVEINDFNVMKIMADAARRMSRGELLQIEISKGMNTKESAYFQLISDKTASLIAAACELGAVVASDDPQKRKVLKDFGENLGMAFQIKDDLFDYLGNESKMGKRMGSDIRENKITLPLIYAFSQSPEEETNGILRKIKRGVKKEDVSEIIEFVKKYGGTDYAVKKGEEYSQKAKQTLDYFDNHHPVKNLLIKFVDFNSNRSI